MNKRLLQINSVINSGSTGRIMEEIGLKAINNGWESYVAYGRNECPSKSNKIKIGNSLDVMWHGMETRLFDRQGLASKNATRKLIEQIKNINPDVIHLHNIHGYYLNIELLFLYFARINTPIIWTLHDCWPFTGHCTHFSFIGCDKWKKYCENCPQKKEYPASFFIDRSKKNYDLKRRLFTSVKNITLVPVSHWLAKKLSESFLNALTVKVIHNGIDINVFYPQKNNTEIRNRYNLQGKFILIGVASVWSRQKGLQDFFRLSKLIGKDELIILVGLTKQQIRNLPHNIIGIERTESVNDLASLYSVADLFINLTWEDSFPTTNLEAMSCGTPVVTYRTGGSPEAITAETGFIVEQGDLKSVVNVINIMKQKGKKEFSDTCRLRVLQYFNKEKCYEEYVDIYKMKSLTKIYG